MIKQVLIAVPVCLFTFLCSNAQNTYSPNSSLGLGEIVTSEYSRTAGMAGVGIGMRNSTFLNASNPAAIAALDSLTGIFDVGVYAKNSNFKANSYNDNAFTGNLSKIAFGFRGTKWWSMSVGIKPYSNVGYHISRETPVEGSATTKTIYLEGSGGLYTLYGINAVKLGKKMSLGVTTMMIAGSYTNTEDQISYTYNKTSRLTQIYNKFGAQYEAGNWVFGATYGYKQKLYVKNLLEIYNSSNVLKDSESFRTTTQFIPESWGGGVSFKRGKFLFAADYEWERWNGLQSGLSNVDIGDSHKIKAGVAYTPIKDLYTAHLAKQYQFGVALNKSYIEVKNGAAWNYAISAGIGIPLRAAQTQRTMLNIGVEYGSNLTAPSGFVKENYVMMTFSFSFIETMFMRNKIF
jgi:hypothetical protein